VAYANSYVKPIVNSGNIINIKDGRHPIVERGLKDSLFVPNDTYLNTDDSRFSIITGPNMAGKSTYMRQTAIIVLMAQVGSFVPASYCEVGIVDAIFTRVGASDDLASGQSTFMVEMNEVSHILKNATEKSLVILDEIGRGTSTYDGLSIAWAVAEYISDKEKIGAKTLFATHYHELTDLENTTEGIKNYSVAVKKRGDDITFLRKIIRGGTDDSFGIEVAKLAGVPDEVITRAKEILASIDSGEKPEINVSPAGAVINEDTGKAGEIAAYIKNLDVTCLTPIEALNELYKLNKIANEE
jgi:DNA mismatch repair protein MutS